MNKGIKKAIEKAESQKAVADYLTRALGQKYTQQGVSRLLNEVKVSVDVAYVLMCEYGIEFEEFIADQLVAKKKPGRVQKRTKHSPFPGPQRSR